MPRITRRELFNGRSERRATTIGIDYQQVIKGLVLLVVVIFDVYNKTRSS